MAAGGGKEIGRLTIRVLPDTDGFRARVKAALAGLDDDIEIGLDLDSDGLRSKVSSAVKAAERGQTINVDVKADDAHLNRLASRMDKIREQKIDLLPGDKIGKFLDDTKKLLKSDDFTVKHNVFEKLESDMKRLERLKNIKFDPIDPDTFTKVADDFRSLMERKKFDLSFDNSAFAQKVSDALADAKPKITPTIDRKLLDEAQKVLESDSVKVRPEIDTSAFSRQAMEARQIAERVLERAKLEAKLTADDREFDRKITEAKAKLQDLVDMKADPEVNAKNIARASALVEKLESDLNALDRKRSNPEVDLKIEKFDLKRAQLLREIDGIKNEISKADSGRVAELEFKLADKQNSVQQITQSINRLKRERVEIDARIEGVQGKIAAIKAQIQDLKDSESDIDFDADISKALAEIASLEAAKSALVSRRNSIRMELDGNAAKKAMNVLSRETSEYAEKAGKILTDTIGDAFGKVTNEADELRASLERISKVKPPDFTPKLDRDAGDRIFKELDAVLRRSDAVEIPITIDPANFSRQAQQARNIARKVLEAADLRVKLDADDADLTRKLYEARNNLSELQRMRVDPEIVARGVEKALAQANLLERELEVLDRFTADPEIRLRYDNAQRAMNQFRDDAERMRRDGYTVEFDADIQRGMIGVRRLETESRKLTEKRHELDFRLKDGAIGKAFDVLTQTTSSAAVAAGNILTNTIGTAFGSMTDMASQFGAKIRGLPGMFMRMTGPIGMVVAGLVAYLAAVAALGAIGIVVAAVGAAIAAAYSLIVTAGAALVPVLGALAIGAGVAALGFDGMKKAAATLKPEFESLKTVASDTFERTMTPQLKKLKPLLDGLEQPVRGIASVIGTELTGAVVTAITEFDKMHGVRTLLDQVGTALKDMAPGLEGVTSAILTMVSNEAGIRILTNAVNELGTAWQEGLKSLDDGTLTRAFEGLDGVIQSVVRAFASLMTNGIRMFASAAPGITKTLDSITGFFNRFDYDRLGAAVGRVFEGISKAIDNIDPATIEKITSAFEGMGEAFNSPEFQGFANSLVEAVAMILEVIPALIETGSAIGQAFVGIAQVIFGGFQMIGGAIQVGMGLLTGDFAMVGDGLKNMMSGWGSVKDGFSNLVDGINSGFDAASSAITSGSSRLKVPTETMIDSVTDILNSGGDKLEGAAKDMGSALQVPPELNHTLPPQWRGLGTGIGGAAQVGIADAARPVGDAAAILGDATKPPEGGLAPPWADATAPIPGAVEGNLSQVPPAVQGPIDQATTAITTGVAEWDTTLNTAITNMGTSMTTGFQGITTTVSTAMNAVTMAIVSGSMMWAASISMSVMAMSVAFMAGFTIMSATAMAGMMMISATIMAGTALWAASIMAGVVAMTAAMAAGFAGMAAIVMGAMAMISAVIMAGTVMWAASVMAGIAMMTAAIAAGFAGIAAVVTAAMMGVTAVIMAASMTWAAAIMAGVAGMVAAAAAGFAGLAAIAAGGMAATTAVIAAGTAGWAAAVAAGSAAMVAAVTGAMAAITGAITGGMAASTAAVVGGAAAMSAAFIAAFAAITAAATSGMAAFVAAVRAGISAGVAACNAAVGQFRAAGANMGRALAAGLNSQVGAVQAAASRLANAAAAATRAAAAIRSPSRVFTELGEYMGEGLAVGMDNGRKYVKVSASRLVNAALGIASEIAQAFGTDLRVEEAFDSLPSQVRSYSSGDFSHSLSDTDFSSVEDRIESAMSQWDIKIDEAGVGRMVNKYNTKIARRK